MSPDIPAPTLHYRYPPRVLAGATWAWLAGRRRSFPEDAAQLLATMRPQPEVDGLDLVPLAGRLVVVANHHYAPGYQSWWNAIVLTALIHSRRPLGPAGIRWAIAAAWTYPDRLRQGILTPLSRLVFRRLAHVYGFVPMPPMPPRPEEVEVRAGAVRQLLRAAQGPEGPPIGLTPEGHDSPDHALMAPPPGAGRLLLHLGAAGMTFCPAAIREEVGRLHVRFGPPFHLQPPAGLPREQRDGWAAGQVMLAIGRLLPPALWGAYRETLAGPSAGL